MFTVDLSLHNLVTICRLKWHDEKRQTTFETDSQLLAGIGCNGHGCQQAWARAGGALAPHSGHVKCFQALVVTAKRSVDELFMHYFHNLSSASGGKSAQTPTGVLSLDSMGTFVTRPLICPPLEKILRALMATGISFSV